jgi:hypothetical protein
MSRIRRAVIITLCVASTLVPGAPRADEHKEKAPQSVEPPRTLHGYVEQEKAFFEYLRANHPIFKYEKEGRLVGKYHISDREEEFLEEGGGKAYQEMYGRPGSITYRLGAQSILDLPNQYVGSKKCGECHPVQYEKWLRSRHNLVVRFPDEVTEVPSLTTPLYGSQAAVLPPGITPDAVFAIIGTPRTKYGFLDAWLVRGTYHVEGGLLKDGTGTLVAGGNQFSRSWAESLTPALAKKTAEWIPGFPTKLEDFGDQGSNQWGMNSYGSKNRKSMLFQPASAYCEVCHTFKFDFKSQEELIRALGKPEELRKHTINKGISCEECHGAGAHLVNARASNPSNCERCHQRFSFLADEAKKNPAQGFNSFFKTACPSCGTEGSQAYFTAHREKGMTCSTCHDPHEVTANDWKDPYTVPGLKKQCKDCHADQAAFFAKNDIHGKNKCESCHMPVMMSCENFAAIQFPDQAGLDAQRTAHIWKIRVDPEAKSLNPPPGKPRTARDVQWRLAKQDGKPFIDLQWSCGRTTFGDGNLAMGCHSPTLSQLPDELHFKNQKQIYDKVMSWEQPVKTGLAAVQAAIGKAQPALAKSKAPQAKRAQAQLMLNQAVEIVDAIRKDGSSGVHAPGYTLQRVKEAKLLADGALELANGGQKVGMK